MILEALSLLCTFENSSNCIITSFDLDSFPESLLKGLLGSGSELKPSQFPLQIISSNTLTMIIPPSGVCTTISSEAGPFPYETETVILIRYRVTALSRVMLKEEFAKGIPLTFHWPIPLFTSR